MRSLSFVRRMIAVLALAALSACTAELTGIEPELSESQLTFVRFAPDAPPLVDTIVSFWAKHGEERSVQILYQTNGYGGNGTCLDFVVPAGSLATGQAPGDSVLITIRVIDKQRFDFRFEPAGLLFNPDQPATLRVWYRWADRDFNGDGVVDEGDRPLAERFGFWRQERPDSPWLQVPTSKDTGSEVITARISGFTRYAAAAD